MADYLIHYNKNHSKANGQFVSGDGDGDGQVNDRAVRKAQKERARAKGKQFAKKAGAIAMGAIGTAAVALGATMLVKEIGKKTNRAFTDEQLEAMGIHVIKLNRIDI